MTTAFGISTYCYRRVSRHPPCVEVFASSPAARVKLPNRTRIAPPRSSPPRSSPQLRLSPPALPVPPTYPTTNVLRDQVGLFLRNIDATLSPGRLSLHQPSEIALKHVSPDQYRTIQHLVDIELPGTGCSAAKMSKLDYYADGTLVITFPTQVHEILTGIVEYIRDQMWEQGFYWKAWSDKKDRIMLSKSITIPLRYKDKKHSFMPDSSLLLYGFEIPFMVCEVAISQTLKSVMEKKHPYLLGSRNMVRFLIIICLRSEKPIQDTSKKRIRDDQPPQSVKCGRSTDEAVPIKSREEPQGQPPVKRIENPPLSSHYKSGCVFVYTTTLQPSKKNPSRRVRSIKTLVENLEFWPAVPAGSLSLTWSDILEGDTPDDVKEKKVEIPYMYLHHMLSDFLHAQEDSSTKIVPHSEDGSDIDVESDEDSRDSNEETAGSLSSEEDNGDGEWTPAG